MADDLLARLTGLMDNPDIGAQLRNLMPGGFDPSKLLDNLMGNPDLLAKIQGLLPGVDIMGGLARLTGAAGGAAVAAGDAAGEATGAGEGLLDKVKGLFGR